MPTEHVFVNVFQMGNLNEFFVFGEVNQKVDVFIN